MDNDTVPESGHEKMTEGALGAWWAQGARSAFMRRPDWSDLQSTPGNLAWLVVVPLALGVAVQRLCVPGPANFYWPALVMNWMPLAVTAWLCWVLVPRASPYGDLGRAPSATALLAMLAAQSLTTQVLGSLIYVPAARDQGGWIYGGPLAWAWLALPVVWSFMATALVLWRGSPRRRGVKAGAIGVLLLTLGAGQGAQTFSAWYPSPVATDGAQDDRRARLTQELLELQPRVLDERLQSLQPPQAGRINVYVITFAPDGDEEVFRREGRLVADLMAERFGSAGRTIQLLNHRADIKEWPWATPLNLQRAIRRVAALMDPQRDILFIHFTSHGATSGALAASLEPLSIDEVTPVALRGWLDDAGIRYRVVSVSACHSGTWIAPLTGDDTLVMTSSDIEHTSYGCGRRSSLTFFGRAMYDEQLRQTRSFEQAHAQARVVIEQREKEAGKKDGYSNPQIAVGPGIRERLAVLEAELDPGPTR